MFTGIVQSQAEIIELNRKNNAVAMKVAVEHQQVNGLAHGASVAINGVCLTTVAFGDLDQQRSYICFDVIDETLRLANFSQLSCGAWVNLERSLKIGDEIGGHIISGHVHGQAQVIERRDTPDNCMLAFQLERAVMKYVFAKGFIGINGISLTVGAVTENSFTVHLIPETLARTNLQHIAIGDGVNIEFDQQTITIVETIERMGLTLPQSLE